MPKTLSETMQSYYRNSINSLKNKMQDGQWYSTATLQSTSSYFRGRDGRAILLKVLHTLREKGEVEFNNNGFNYYTWRLIK